MKQYMLGFSGVEGAAAPNMKIAIFLGPAKVQKSHYSHSHSVIVKKVHLCYIYFILISGDRMRHDFGFSDTDVCNIDKIIEALRELVFIFILHFSNFIA